MSDPELIEVTLYPVVGPPKRISLFREACTFAWMREKLKCKRLGKYAKAGNCGLDFFCDRTASTYRPFNRHIRREYGFHIHGIVMVLPQGDSACFPLSVAPVPPPPAADHKIWTANDWTGDTLLPDDVVKRFLITDLMNLSNAHHLRTDANPTILPSREECWRRLADIRQVKSCFVGRDLIKLMQYAYWLLGKASGFT